ncbi:MAG: hypothetical protein EHM33_25065 [Chloroflexi bacterium]|nr:MAG: hypothetical protein EHM33_25065 [Chloroflexota bacterium]
MESFSRGWSFLRQAWQMAFKDKDLIKPSIYALIVGSIVSVIGAIPIIIAAFFLGDAGRIGQFILAVMGAFLVFLNFVISYVFSGMTAYLIYEYLTHGDGRMSTAWSIVRRDFFDLVTLAAVSTGVNLLKNAANRNRNRRGGIAAGLISAAAGLLEVLWTEAAFLILPAMVIEDMNLSNAAKRVAQIVKDNLLLVGVSTVGVRAVTGLIGFVLGAGGAVLGFGIGYGIIAILGAGTLGLVFGIGIGLLIFLAFTMVASVSNTYTSTAYHTCLYLWARNVEVAQMAGQPIRVTAPAPLAAVLG